jgi:cytosine/uracil/thiamine/allantoin permease
MQGEGMLVDLYNYAWFTGLAIAGLVYWVLMKGRVTAEATP